MQTRSLRKMSLGAPDECCLVGFVTAWSLCIQLMIKMYSVLSLPRCPSGNASPYDHQHYHDGGWAGCSLHGNEVHHLWGRWQNTQVSHRHDWRHHHPDWRWDIFSFFYYSQWTVCLIKFFLQLCVPSLPVPGTPMKSSEPSTTHSPLLIPSKYFSVETK